MNCVVLISGNGSNLQTLIDNAAAIDLQISAVISNVRTAHGLKRAAIANIPTHIIEHQPYKTRDEFDENLANLINQYQPDLIVLAGFMRILTAKFTTQYLGKMLNIHPSLLPKFQGLNTHQRALDAGEAQHGASVHFVTQTLDGGPIIAQTHIDILPSDNAPILAARLLKKEHKLLLKVVRQFTQGRLKLRGNHAFLDGKIL